jgi:hypothetical protein
MVNNSGLVKQKEPSNIKKNNMPPYNNRLNVKTVYYKEKHIFMERKSTLMLPLFQIKPLYYIIHNFIFINFIQHLMPAVRI